MTQLVWLLNGTNKNYDTQLTALAKALLSSSCVVRGVGGGLAVSATEVASWEAFISCTRTNGEKVMVHYKNSEAVSIVGTGTKKVFVKVDQAKLDNGSGNALDGSGIASIQTDTVYPSNNYVALASIASSVITDARVYDDTVLFTLETILKEKKGSDIASGTTTDLSTATWNLVHITGTTTIASFGTVQAWVSIKLVFDWALILTQHASNLILPGGANITTSAWDSWVFVSEWGGAWKCISYQKANGQAVVLTTSPDASDTTKGVVELSTEAEYQARTWWLVPTNDIIEKFWVNTNIGNTWRTFQHIFNKNGTNSFLAWSGDSFGSPSSSNAIWAYIEPNALSTISMQASIPWFSPTSGIWEYRIQDWKGIRMGWDMMFDDTTNRKAFWFCVTRAGMHTVESDTTNGTYRFLLNGASLFTHVANGSVAQNTDVTSGITVTRKNTYMIEIMPTYVKFYINGTQVAHYTTNLPTTGTLLLGIWFQSSGSVRSLRVTNPTISIQR
jgi:hypothetical protein